MAAGYAVICLIPIYLMRSSESTALELAQTLRYLPNLVVVLALWQEWGSAHRTGKGPHSRHLTWPDRGNGRCHSHFRRQQPVFDRDVLGELADNPAQPYLQNRVRGSAAYAASDAPMLDQEVDPLVLQRVAFPENLASHMFALLRDSRGSPLRQANCGCSTPADVWSTPRSPGCARSSGAGAAVRLLRAAGFPSPHAAGWAAAAGRLDRRDQLPGQQ